MVRKAGIASPRYDQLISAQLRIINEPAMTRAPPVAQLGMDAKIGAKKIETKKHNPAVIPVKPVRPPSAIPVEDSMKAVTGEVPIKAPMLIEKASTM